MTHLDPDLAALIARDPALATLAVVLDPERRTEAIGAATRVDRLRYKPSSSIVASFTKDADGDTPGDDGTTTGWIATYNSPSKVAKTLARAARAGFSAYAVDGLPGVVVGETRADRMLAVPLAVVRSHEAELFAHAVVLRHNPHRRVVFRSQLAGTPVVLKVSADEVVPVPTAPGAAATPTPVPMRQQAMDALDSAGVPVIRPVAVAGIAGVETVDWWGDGDLTATPLPSAAHAAGVALARLHTAPLGAEVRDVGVRGADNTPGGGPSRPGSAARTIATILPAEAARAARIDAQLRQPSRAIPTRPRSLVHGDFSPDQVLVGGTEIRLIDFDRATVDSPERDLGSFLAAADLLGHTTLGAAMLAGYATAGGFVDEDLLHSFTAQAFLQRAVEPFRALEPDWVARTRYALDRAESEAAWC
jgi:aminoglycoside phosphotransferase (APT) family kinase protein